MVVVRTFKLFIYFSRFSLWDCGTASFTTLVLSRNPLSDVRRTVEQREATSTAPSEKTNSFYID